MCISYDPSFYSVSIMPSNIASGPQSAIVYNSVYLSFNGRYSRIFLLLSDHLIRGGVIFYSVTAIKFISDGSFLPILGIWLLSVMIFLLIVNSCFISSSLGQSGFLNHSVDKTSARENLSAGSYYKRPVTNNLRESLNWNDFCF